MRACTSLVSALVLSGCFAVNDPSMHEPEPVDATEFCSVFAEVFCAALDCGSCVPPEGEPDPLRDRCTDGFMDFCQRDFGPLLADTRAGYDEVEMGEQLARGRRAVQECDGRFWQWVNGPDGLISGFVGTARPGDTCNPASPGSEAHFFYCAGSRVCMPGTSSWRCENRVGEGEPCLRGQCARDLTCEGPVRMQGTCGTTRGAPGAPCDEHTDCISASCDNVREGGNCLDVDATYCGLREP